MLKTFDALTDNGQPELDPSVTPDVSNDMDIAAIVQRLNDLTDKVDKLTAQLGANNPAAQQDNTSAPAADEPQEEKNEKKESEETKE